MSHRTQDLEELTGLAHLIRELRYNEIARQGLAIVLILLFALTSRPGPAAVIYASMAAAMIGMLIRLYASGYIVKNKQLATNGPYAVVRHPLYTGNILLVIGFAVANMSLWAVPLSLFFFWFWYPTAIEYEDRKLNRIFGEDWQQWSRQTPALMPKLSNLAGMAGGNWSLATSLRKNGEIIVVVFVLICAYLVLAPLL